MKRAGGFGTAAALALAWACAAPAAGPVTLKFATLAPEGSAWMQKFEQIKKDVADATGGQVKLKVYPSGVMGEEKDVLFKIKVGQLDGGGFLGNGISRICPEVNAAMFPLTFRSFEEVDAVFPKLQEYFDVQAKKHGFVALGWTEVGFSYLYSTAPVGGLADLRKSKVWAIPNEEMLAELFKDAGVSTIPVTVGDVLTALQTGLIETVYAPPLAAVAMQWHTRIKHRSDLRVAYTFGGLFVSETAWNRVPAEFRDKIAAIARQRTSELTAQVRKSDEEALAVLVKNGIGTVPVAEADAKELAKISDGVRARLRGQLFPAEADDLVQKLLAGCRAKPAAEAPRAP